MYMGICADPYCPYKREIEELKYKHTQAINKLKATSRAVGGKEGIIRCLQAGNDAPLDLVLQYAQDLERMSR